VAGGDGFRVVAADRGAAGNAHLRDTHAGHAVAEARALACGEQQGHVRQADPKSEDGLRQGFLVHGERGGVSSRFRPQAREGDGDPALPERAPQMGGVLEQADQVEQGLSQAQQRTQSGYANAAARARAGASRRLW